MAAGGGGGGGNEPQHRTTESLTAVNARPSSSRILVAVRRIPPPSPTLVFSSTHVHFLSSRAHCVRLRTRRIPLSQTQCNPDTGSNLQTTSLLIHCCPPSSRLPLCSTPWLSESAFAKALGSMKICGRLSPHTSTHVREFRAAASSIREDETRIIDNGLWIEHHRSPSWSGVKYCSHGMGQLPFQFPHVQQSERQALRSHLQL